MNDSGVLVPSPESLLAEGPTCQVCIRLPDIVVAQLEQEGKPVPPAVEGLALIDTGAYPSLIDGSVARALGLAVIGTMPVPTLSHKSMDHDLHQAHIEVPGIGLVLDSLTVASSPAISTGPAKTVIMLIGRDILQHCTLFYDGLEARCVLTNGPFQRAAATVPADGSEAPIGT